MNKLWVKLGLAFALVTLVGIAAVGLLANYQLSTGFHRYITQNQVDIRLVPALQTYYQQTGSWEGVESIFGAQAGTLGRGKGRGAPKHTLADASGRVVYDETGNYQTLSKSQRKQAIPIELDGETIGYLLISVGNGASGPAQAFLALITQSLVQAGIVAGLLGLLLGFLIARHLSNPLDRLARAARRLSHGDLGQRVPVSGSDEVMAVMTAFNEMAEALQRSEQLRQNMIADIAHELRTPLSVIQGNLQAMLDGVYPMNEEEIAHIYDETLLLNRLVTDLRALTQAEAGQLHLNLVPTEPGELVSGMAETFREAAREKNIMLETAVTPGLPTILADPDRLRQVFANLISNALRHTPAGGVITLAAEPAGAGVRFSVSDTGPGLTPEEQAHVFERFWRADASRSRDKGGSGLGLTIARYLIEAHGGEMGVESEPGQGATFWFVLPAGA
jgi:two-component system OmpR family sensor kinase/two-component system sensor histidine kinase BaeS